MRVPTLRVDREGPLLAPLHHEPGAGEDYAAMEVGEPEPVPNDHERLLLVEHAAEPLRRGGRNEVGWVLQPHTLGAWDEGLGRPRLPDRVPEEGQPSADRDVPSNQERGPVLNPRIGERGAPEGISFG